MVKRSNERAAVPKTPEIAFKTFFLQKTVLFIQKEL